LYKYGFMHSVVDTDYLLASSDRKLFLNMQKSEHCLNRIPDKRPPDKKPPDKRPLKMPTPDKRPPGQKASHQAGFSMEKS